MCGIYGYVGKNNAYNIVLDGLKMLQYRGYDSCGITYYDNGFKINKAVGTLDNLDKFSGQPHIAFGHTRWATNGEVNLKNTHPHISYDKKFFVVHNGIITNAIQLKKDLQKQNISFYSDTDTEIIANLIASLKGTVEENLKSLYHILHGSFSLIVGCENGELYLLKKFSPLNLLISNDEIFISSDIASLPSGKLYTLQDGDIIKISENKIKIVAGKNVVFNNNINKKNNFNLGNFNHYMLKEIYETPTAILNTYNYLKELNLLRFFKGIKHITMLGCGTAYHSCLIGEYLLNQLDRFEIKTALASTIKINKKIPANNLFIIVSQSGETADCIKAAEKIKEYGGKILVITNQEKSSITKFANNIILTKSGTEFAVASTKTYCSQIFIFAYIFNVLKNKNYSLDISYFVKNLSNYIEEINVDHIVNKLAKTDKLILIAKDVDYLTMLEASLKIREIDYVYTIPIIASELKHGTLSLIDKNSLIFSLNTCLNKTKLTTAINEIKSRGGEVVECEKLLNLNCAESCYMPIFSVVPFQIISYKVALLKGNNPDMPRNLAKSVTVE